MERVMEEFERCCHENMTHAMETEEGLGIEYDEDVVCDVCQSPDGEDNNEMVFCDKCNICVHQVSRHLPFKMRKKQSRPRTNLSSATEYCSKSVNVQYEVKSVFFCQF